MEKSWKEGSNGSEPPTPVCHLPKATEPPMPRQHHTLNTQFTSNLQLRTPNLTTLHIDPYHPHPYPKPRPSPRLPSSSFLPPSLRFSPLLCPLLLVPPPLSRCTSALHRPLSRRHSPRSFSRSRSGLRTHSSSLASQCFLFLRLLKWFSISQGSPRFDLLFVVFVAGL